MDSEFSALIDQLSHPKSPKRRSAAKRLRKLGDRAAGPFLLEALKKELKDKRTWETQYQLIMAVGHCDYRPALKYILSLADESFVGMVHIAIGDTLLRLSRQNERDVQICFDLIENGNRELVSGAIQAIAMLRMVPSDQDIQRLIEYGVSLELGAYHDGDIMRLLRAAPGWPAELVEPLFAKLSSVDLSKKQHIQAEIDLAKEQKYHKWSPL
ncbi:MAG: hypothetical protein AAGA25_16395 [Planctomycetota bacterium]